MMHHDMRQRFTHSAIKHIEARCIALLALLQQSFLCSDQVILTANGILASSPFRSMHRAFSFCLRLGIFQTLRLPDLAAAFTSRSSQP